MVVASTVTCSLPAPIWSVAFTVNVLEVSTGTPLETYSLKLPALTWTSYVPTASSGIEYVPLAPVVTERDSPVLVLTAVTCAPETTAPWGSVTTPVIVPVYFCANSGAHKDKEKERRSTTHEILRIPIALRPANVQTTQSHRKTL